MRRDLRHLDTVQKKALVDKVAVSRGQEEPKSSHLGRNKQVSFLRQGKVAGCFSEVLFEA